MKVKYNSGWVPGGYRGISLWPRIHIALSKDAFIKKYGEERLKKTLCHERIHIKQQAETLVILFYLIYGINWLINLPKHGKTAYRNIGFEREAYENAGDKKYLETRKPLAWLNYVKKK